MFESQGTTPAQQDSTTPKPTYEELEAKLALVTETADTWRSNYYESQDLITKARRHFEEILSGDIDAQQTYEDFQIPFELLGVEATREVQVTVTASWSGSVHLPYGTDLDDVAMSFTAEFDDLEGSVGWHADDYEIREG